MFGPPRIWKQNADHVSSRPTHQETGVELDRESVVTTIDSSQSKGKRDRDSNVVHSLRDTENLQKILQRKVDSAVRGELLSQQELYESEVMLRQEIGKREILTSLFTWLTRNLNFCDFSYIKQLDGRIKLKRDKISLHGELDMRNRPFQENHA